MEEGVRMMVLKNDWEVVREEKDFDDIVLRCFLIFIVFRLRFRSVVYLNEFCGFLFFDCKNMLFSNVKVDVID